MNITAGTKLTEYSQRHDRFGHGATAARCPQPQFSLFAVADTSSRGRPLRFDSSGITKQIAQFNSAFKIVIPWHASCNATPRSLRREAVWRKKPFFGAALVLELHPLIANQAEPHPGSRIRPTEDGPAVNATTAFTKDGGLSNGTSRECTTRFHYWQSTRIGHHRRPRPYMDQASGSGNFMLVTAMTTRFQNRQFVWAGDRAAHMKPPASVQLKTGFSCGWSMGKDFLNYEGWTATNFVVGVGVITVDAVVESSPAGCPSCGRLAICLEKHGTKTREIADIPVRGARVVIRLKRQRYICFSCEATTFQPLLGVTGTKRLTDRLAGYIATMAVTEPFVKVARETGLSPKKIRRVFVEFAARELESRNIDTPYSLGIDDVYVDRVARCVLVDNDTHGLYELLPRRNKTSLNRFLLKIPNRHQVRVVTIDMCAPFRDAVRNALPNAVVVVDRFHIQRFANDAAKQVAKSVKPRKKSAKGFTRDRFLLLHDPEDLNETQKANKDRWLKHEPLVYQAYVLKEAYLDIWKIRDRGQAEAAYDDWLIRIPDELKEAFRKLTTAMKNWRAEVFNYWDHRYTNATCESHNRIIKDIQRTGQSYDFETVRAKALLRNLQKQKGLTTKKNARTTHEPVAEFPSKSQAFDVSTNTAQRDHGFRVGGGFNMKILDPEAQADTD